MATNRHAQVRYTILDRCFSNPGRLYDYDDLLFEVNEALSKLGSDGIQLRQLQYDIEHMKSDTGWSIELEKGLRKQETGKKAWRYNDLKFSIANHPLNVNDIEQLETTLSILSRYKHREEFNWLEELIPRMKQAFDLADKGENGIISYQENEFLKGRNHLGVLFNVILKEKKIKIGYKPFYGELVEYVISPLHLKQYNNRWFLFAKPSDFDKIHNYPLDRIETIEELSESAEKIDINWIDYFDDVIGVTKPEGKQVEKICLKFSESRIQYVITKPLHGTQKVNEADRTVTIEVVPNNELYQLLMSFGEDLEVISPEVIRIEIKKKINAMINKY
ncbi:helix-turn-helix transcriptional regulator [Winogradskyella poriferorum]|uniref:helix-turn-helix transcriptional regulator n=1 Tax=Winogradskyella poriferorum TaxID=307627 RepID=UPI003D660D72